MVLWVAQAVTTMGFSFTFPFFPLFFEELGAESTERAAFLAGVAGWVFGIGMALGSPIWGVIGDRYGRKLNVVRAMMLGAVFLGLTGFSQNAGQLIVARFFVGATSGVVPTIMALVAAHTPRHRLAFASGAVQSSLFLGIAIGPLFGGVIFDAFGMRAAFYATAAALIVAGLLVQLLVREDFRRPESHKRPLQPFIDLWRLSTSKALLPLFLITFLVLAANLGIQPAIPGLVDLVEGGSSSGAASGVVFGVMGAGSSVSAVVMGWLAGRAGLQRVLLVGASAAAVASLIPFVAGSYLTLTVGVASIALFAGGLAGLVNGLIAMRAPRDQHGAAFGGAQVSHAFGVALGPLAGGASVVVFGLRSVFLLDLVLFVAVAVVVVIALSGRRAAPAEPAAPTP